MTRRDWIVSIYAGAAFGGVLWMALPLVTKLLGSSPPAPNTLLWTLGTSMIVGATGLVLFRTTSGTTSRRAGAAVSIGAFIGLPVLAWFALW